MIASSKWRIALCSGAVVPHKPQQLNKITRFCFGFLIFRAYADHFQKRSLISLKDKKQFYNKNQKECSVVIDHSLKKTFNSWQLCLDCGGLCACDILTKQFVSRQKGGILRRIFYIFRLLSRESDSVGGLIIFILLDGGIEKQIVLRLINDQIQTMHAKYCCIHVVWQIQQDSFLRFFAAARTQLMYSANKM